VKIFTFISDTLTELFHFTDPRVADWFLLGSPFHPLALLAVYMYFVKVAGPQYMKNRPAFQLNGVISVYNVIQIILNMLLFLKVSKRNYIHNC